MDNMNKLLLELENKKRTAQFRTIFTYIDEKECLQFEGVVRGKIATEITGEGGFGYDPIFYPEDSELTFAEMTLSEKNTMSHRARALAKLVEFLNNHCVS